MSTEKFVRVPSVEIRVGAVLAAAVLALLALALPLRAVGGPSRDGLEEGFMHFLRASGIDPSALEEREASRLFQLFISRQPEYGRLPYKQGRSDAVEPEIVPRHAIASVDLVVESFETTIDGKPYIVELRAGKLTDGADFLKATLRGPDGVRDPWLYATRSVVFFRVCSIICFWIPIGDDYWLYVDFVTNADGVNEAAIFKSRVGEWAVQGGGLAALVGFIAALLTEGWGGIIAVAGGYQAAWVNYVVQTAYDSTKGIRIALYLRWFYSGIGFFAFWAYWWIDLQWHRAIPAPWLDPFTLQINGVLRDAMITIGNKIGWNRWFWAGPYRG